MLWSDETSPCPRQLYSVPALWNWSRENDSPLIIRGLIIQRLPGRGQYERVGMFMTANYSQFPNVELAQDILCHIPTQALNESSDGALPGRSHAQVTGDDRYLIWSLKFSSTANCRKEAQRAAR